jgi:Zn-dependent peptidase ImmA (M78 family)
LYRKTSPNDKAYKDPEWQAKCFAGELLMDYEMTEGMSTLEIVKNCKVTLDAARYRAKKY